MRPRASFIVISYALLCLAGGFSLVMPESSATQGAAIGQTVHAAEAATAVDAQPRSQIQLFALEP